MSAPEAGPCLLQSLWNGRALHCLQPARPCLSQDPAPAQHSQHRATAMPHRANPVPSLGTGTRSATAELSPVPTAALGQSQGKVMQSQAGSAIRSHGLLESPSSNPCLCSGGTGSLRGTGALPGARDVSLSPWACVQAAAARTEGRDTETAFIYRVSPKVPQEGNYSISPCLEVWKQPRLLKRGELPWGQCAHRPTAG